jgi:tubulin beta
LLECLREEFPSIISSAISIVPCKTADSHAPEPYNVVLGMNYLIENTDMTILLDNAKLAEISGEFSLPEMNKLAAASICCLTASMRFPGYLNTDLRRLASNMVPFQRVNVVVPSFVHGPGLSDTGPTSLSGLVE